MHGMCNTTVLPLFSLYGAEHRGAICFPLCPLIYFLQLSKLFTSRSILSLITLRAPWAARATRRNLPAPRT